MNNDSNNLNNQDNTNNQVNNSNNINRYVNNKDYNEGEYTNVYGGRSHYYLNKNPFVWGIAIAIIAVVFGMNIFANMFFKKAYEKMEDAMKMVEEEKETLGDEITLGENDLKKRKEVVENLKNLFDFTEISEYSYLMDNDDFRFMFFIYLTKDYSDNTKTLVTGETNVEGAFSMNINSIKSYYLKFFGKDFDYTKLYMKSGYYGKDTYYDSYYAPELVGDIIYAKYNNESNIDNNIFKYVKTTYNEKSGVYADVIAYTNNKRNESFYMALRYTIDPKGFVTYKSFKMVQ